MSVPSSIYPTGELLAYLRDRSHALGNRLVVFDHLLARLRGTERLPDKRPYRGYDSAGNRITLDDYRVIGRQVDELQMHEESLCSELEVAGTAIGGRSIGRGSVHEIEYYLADGRIKRRLPMTPRPRKATI